MAGGYNLFGGRGDVADLIDLGNDSFDRGSQMVDQARARYAGKRAAPLIAKGDYRGAAGAYGEAGLASEAAKLAGAADEQDANAAARQRQATSDQMAMAEKRVSALRDIAKGLMTVPQGQRMQALQQAMPVFQGLGIDPQVFGQLDESHLTDDQLGVFAGELDKQWQAMSYGGDGLARYNNRTGDFEVVSPPTPKPEAAMTPEKVIGPLLQKQASGQPLTPAETKLVNRWYSGTPSKASGGGGGRAPAGLPPPPTGWTPR